MNVQAFLNTLPIMGRGMLGIFAVMLVIFLLILVLNGSRYVQRVHSSFAVNW